eukprot:gene16509-biopygen3747
MQYANSSVLQGGERPRRPGEAKGNAMFLTPRCYELGSRWRGGGHFSRIREVPLADEKHTALVVSRSVRLHGAV